MKRYSISKQIFTDLFIQISHQTHWIFIQTMITILHPNHIVLIITLVWTIQSEIEILKNWCFAHKFHLFNKEVFGSDSLDYGDIWWGDIEFIMVNHLEFGKVVKSDWQFSNSIFQCHNSFIRSGLFATIFHYYLIPIRLFNFQEEWNSETLGGIRCAQTFKPKRLRFFHVF